MKTLSNEQLTTVTGGVNTKPVWRFKAPPSAVYPSNAIEHNFWHPDGVRPVNTNPFIEL